MTHRQAVWLMVMVALMWSIAGVVTRWLDSARGFEVTFWRSAFNALALVLLLSRLRGPAAVWRRIRQGGLAFWTSGVCWAVMFTAFMLALTLTTVANVLITMALAPLFTALAARFFLRQRLPLRTWLAIALAGIGIAWMYGQQVSGADAQQVLGTAVALGVPIAAAVNWTLMQHLHHGDDEADDMLPAVLVGALMSAAVTLPLALPFSSSGHDLALLGLLGAVQLAIPCLLAMVCSRVLKAPEMSLLALLEVVFGVLWAWLGAGEAPTLPVLGGGALVLVALVTNETLALARAPDPVAAGRAGARS
ncbi:MAG: DMT family transporter [Rubrivivax sp.]|nr:DMT family transporter [Rubrivivax sp.]MBK7262992.1 DMT family transporter [Rubrivivax sp.]MBK8529166.1 DMT family transporter [Rubrivivax sp.]